MINGGGISFAANGVTTAAGDPPVQFPTIVAGPTGRTGDLRCLPQEEDTIHRAVHIPVLVVDLITINVQAMEDLEIGVILPRDTVEVEVAVTGEVITGTVGETTVRIEEAVVTISRNPKGHEEMIWTRVVAPA